MARRTGESCSASSPFATRGLSSTPDARGKEGRHVVPICHPTRVKHAVPDVSEACRGVGINTLTWISATLALLVLATPLKNTGRSSANT